MAVALGRGDCRGARHEGRRLASRRNGVRKAEDGPARGKALVKETLEEWKTNIGLSGVRDEDELRSWRTDEQKTWRELWGEVENVLKRAKG